MDGLALGLILAFLLPLVLLGALVGCFWKLSQVHKVREARRYGRLSILLLLAVASMEALVRSLVQKLTGLFLNVVAKRYPRPKMRVVSQKINVLAWALVW